MLPNHRCNYPGMTLLRCGGLDLREAGNNSIVVAGDQESTESLLKFSTFLGMWSLDYLNGLNIYIPYPSLRFLLI